MSMWAQISLHNGRSTVRISDRWGIPVDVIPDLHTLFLSGMTDARRIARAYVAMPIEAGWHGERFLHERRIIAKDMEQGSTNYRYTVDLSVRPWTVLIENCEGCVWDNDKQQAGPRIPATFETVTLSPRAVKLCRKTLLPEELVASAKVVEMLNSRDRETEAMIRRNPTLTEKRKEEIIHALREFIPRARAHDAACKRRDAEKRREYEKCIQRKLS